MVELLGVKLHLYGLLIGIGVFTAWEIVKIYGTVEERILAKLAPWLVFFGIVGARAYHVVDLWGYYSNNLKEIFYVWNGGLGIWGALLGGGIFLNIYAYFNKLNFLKLIDSIVIGVPFGQAIGRLGNYVNGELYGKNGEPLFAWEGGLNVLLGMFLIYISGCSCGDTRNKLLKSGMTLPTATLLGGRAGLIGGVYLIGYGLIRIFLENFRPDSVIWRIGGIPTAIIFGVAAVVLGSILIVKKTSYFK